MLDFKNVKIPQFFFCEYALQFLPSIQLLLFVMTRQNEVQSVILYVRVFSGIKDIPLYLHFSHNSES